MIQHDGYLICPAPQPNADWLVLVHGVSQDHRLFEQQVQAFRFSHNLMLIDLPGHGVSQDTPGPYGLTEFADHILNSIDKVGVQTAVLWGTYLGASAGLLAACARSEAFAHLILEAPVFPGRALPSVAQILPRLVELAQTEGIEAAREHWWQHGPWFDHIRAQPVRFRAQKHRNMIDTFGGAPWLQPDLVSKPLEDVEVRLSELKTPILLINGQFDPPDFIEASNQLATVLTHARQVTIPNAGGFPLWEQPGIVNTVICEALGMGEA